MLVRRRSGVLSLPGWLTRCDRPHPPGQVLARESVCS
jgi:hypothetical protein